MYKLFFCMLHSSFVRNVPLGKLFESNVFQETLGHLSYVVD